MSLREEILIDKLKSDLSIENAKIIALQKDVSSDEVSVLIKSVLLTQYNCVVAKIKKMIIELEQK